MKTTDEFVYFNIGKAFVSIQKVEFLTGQLLAYLLEFDEGLYGVTSKEFLSESRKAKKSRKTLGEIFRLHKLNPKLVVERELNEFLALRNQFVHGFYESHLSYKNEEQVENVVSFCKDIGKRSSSIESHFRGFMYFLTLTHVKSSDLLPFEFVSMRKDFERFIKACAH